MLESKCPEDAPRRMDIPVVPSLTGYNLEQLEGAIDKVSPFIKRETDKEWQQGFFADVRAMGIVIFCKVMQIDTTLKNLCQILPK